MPPTPLFATTKMCLRICAAGLWGLPWAPTLPARILDKDPRCACSNNLPKVCLIMTAERVDLCSWLKETAYPLNHPVQVETLFCMFLVR